MSLAFGMRWASVDSGTAESSLKSAAGDERRHPCPPGFAPANPAPESQADIIANFALLKHTPFSIIILGP